MSQPPGRHAFLPVPEAVAVSAHVPQVRYDPSTRLQHVATLRRESGRLALLAEVRSATTVADLKAALLTHLQEEGAG